MSSNRTYWIWKRSQLLCWNGFNRRKPPILLNAVGLGVVCPPYSYWYAWLLVVCEGSVLVLMSEFLFSIKKKKRTNNKWVCMWVLHAIVLICTGVPKKPYVARSPILKRQAALQLWPGTTSLIQRDCNSSPCPWSRVLTWGEGGRGGTQLPPPSDCSRRYVRGEKPHV